MSTHETHEVAKDTVVTLEWEPESTRWEVIGDLRAPRSELSDDANYMCRDTLAPLFPHVDWDPETSCFYAYTKTREHAIALIEAIEGWLVSHRAGWEAARREDDDLS